MADYFSPARRCLVECTPIYYPLGGKKCRNVLQNFKQSKTSVKVLFLGCHDLRNVLQTLASQPIEDNINFSMDLNHPCQISLARNLLILTVISAPDFNVNNPEDVNYLWDLWYNLKWPETTLKRFVVDVRNLLENTTQPQDCMANAVSVQLKNSIKVILHSWLSLSLSKNLKKTSFLQNILKERLKLILYRGIGEGGQETAKMIGLVTEETFIDTLNSFAVWRNLAMSTGGFPDTVKTKLFMETKTFYETGNCNPTSKFDGAMFPNPTLLEPQTHRWRVDCNSCPFDTYLPLPLDELETSAEEGIATRYCQKVLKNLVATFQRRKENIRFRLHQNNDLQFCLNGTTEKFDVIDTSSLADEVGLANLLESCSRRLESHPHALLISESLKWDKIASTVALYVEESLCAPLSMIPTIYGFRLKNNIELGCPSLRAGDSPFSYLPVTLSWLRTPRLENVPLSISPSLKNCLKKMMETCFVPGFSETVVTTVNDSCGIMSYTPQTFNFVARKINMLAEKQGKDTWIKNFKTKMAPQFRLAQATLDASNDNRPVTLVTATQPYSHEDKEHLLVFSGLHLPPLLRLLLMPCNTYIQRKKSLACRRENLPVTFEDNWREELPHLHYIDNFDLSFPKNQENSICSIQVKFILPESIENVLAYCGVVVDTITGIEIYNMGVVIEMQLSVMSSPLLSSVLSPLSQENVQGPHMKAVYCQESENDYIIRVNAPCVPEGLKITSDREFPCESAHKITFSFDKQREIKPITLCFPYPVLVEDFGLRRWDRSFQVVLKKSLYEPWPCHFKEPSKWNVAQYPVWKEPRANQYSIKSHVAGFDVQPNQPTSLNDVRSMIVNIFLRTMEGFEFFTINSDPCMWHLRIHAPILTTPSGCPLLLITAFDHRLSQKLSAEGSLSSKQVDDDFKRIFDTEKLPSTLSASREETCDLFRYVLRLNSTKMIPTLWQVDNVLLDKKSPYLATFLTMLYLDKEPYEDDKNVVEDATSAGLRNQSFEDPSFKPSGCSTCHKGDPLNLKLCSRCKMTYYCSVQCQRADWQQHKLLCTLF